MHPAEYYALKIGAKIEKPKIYEKFQPIPYRKFIIINTKNSQYRYWQEVLDLIHAELLKNDYGIINVSSENSLTLKKCSIFLDKNDLGRMAYICGQASLYIGPPSLEGHICGALNTRMILVANLEDVMPYQINLRKTKIFNLNNDLWPEILANEILKLLKIKNKINIKTHYIGEDFLSKRIEIVPQNFFDLKPIELIPNHIVRMDLNFDEIFLNKFLSLKKSIIFTNRPIDINIIKNNINSIISIVYIIDEKYDLNFIKSIKGLGIGYKLISYKTETEIEKYKYDLMDYGIIHKKEINKKNIKFNLNLQKYYFNSARIIYDGQKMYSSEYHYAHNLPKNISEEFIADKDLFKDLEDFHIFSIDK